MHRRIDTLSPTCHFHKGGVGTHDVYPLAAPVDCLQGSVN
jgi:hypothetical protein